MFFGSNVAHAGKFLSSRLPLPTGWRRDDTLAAESKGICGGRKEFCADGLGLDVGAELTLRVPLVGRSVFGILAVEFRALPAARGELPSFWVETVSVVVSAVTAEKRLDEENGDRVDDVGR